MGWDPESQQLQPLSEEQAQNWRRGPVFHEGEEVVIKGLTFVIVDIAPGQIKLKPKKMATEHRQELDAAKQKLADQLEQLTTGG